MSHIGSDRSPNMSLSTRVLQKIVRNEAMASDPPEIYGWRVYLLACSVSPSMGLILAWSDNHEPHENLEMFNC